MGGLYRPDEPTSPSRIGSNLPMGHRPGTTYVLRPPEHLSNDALASMIASLEEIPSMTVDGRERLSALRRERAARIKDGDMVLE